MNHDEYNYDPDDTETEFDIHDPKHRIVADDGYSVLYQQELHREQDRNAIRWIVAFAATLLLGAIIACAS